MVEDVSDRPREPDTLREMVCVLLQPLLVPVTVWVADTVGLKIIAGVVKPLSHKYPEAPLAVKDTVPPAHTVFEEEVTFTTGFCTTFTAITLLAVQDPLTPNTVKVAFATGITEMDEDVAPVFQL